MSAYKALVKLYGQNPMSEADIVVVLGGDGFLLQVLGESRTSGKSIYGMNRGSVGFLLNTYTIEGLPERLDTALAVSIRRLRIQIKTTQGEVVKATAVNDLALFRESGQSAHIAITVNDVVRIQELVSDGVIVATPAGSTGYSLSAHGPILPLRSNLLALTPVSAFRPRRWPGALLDNTSKITLEVLDPEKRPVAATADSKEIRGVKSVAIESDPRFKMRLLFDDGHELEERILREQFTVH